MTSSSRREVKSFTMYFTEMEALLQYPSALYQVTWVLSTNTQDKLQVCRKLGVVASALPI